MPCAAPPCCSDRDYAGADPVMLDLLRWHGAEEVEHRALVYDVYQDLSGSYALRCAAMLFRSELRRRRSRHARSVAVARCRRGRAPGARLRRLSGPERKLCLALRRHAV